MHNFGCKDKYVSNLIFVCLQDRKNVISPIIDVISMDNFDYIGASADLRGGTAYVLSYCWAFNENLFSFLSVKDFDLAENKTSVT